MSTNSNSLNVPAASGISISVPMAAPQTLLSSTKNNVNAGVGSGGGSATGNPRNKCALKPGHSLMDWIRLGNSGVDLAGTCGRVIPITTEELARHNKIDDAWMAIRGKVFNVTRYMDFHPGGVDELMRGVGRDATKLFDEVHAWVNYPQLLGKCYIGPLRQNVEKPANDLRKSLLAKSMSGEFAKPPLPMPIETEIVPRFDWIQQRSELTLYIYTRQLANPGIILQKKSTQNLRLLVQISAQWHGYDFELQNDVVWPPKALRIGAETGKIEIVLSKTEATPWTTYGAHKVAKVISSEVQEARYDFELSRISNINHDSFEISLRSAHQNAIILPPIGYHVAIEGPVNASIVSRSYTPVNSRFLNSNESCKNETKLHFLIKSYENGQLTPHLRQLQSAAIVQLSAPRGSFNLQPLAAHRNILLLAAGSGLTPFLNMLEPLLKRNTNRLETLRLIYFNKTEEDIWIRENLAQIAQEDERFTCQHVLSQSADTWTGLKGRVSEALLSPLISKGKYDSATYIAICGSNAFNASTMDILKELNFKMDNVHVFQG